MSVACARCGVPLPAGGRACARCGTVVAAPRSAQSTGGLQVERTGNSQRRPAGPSQSGARTNAAPQHPALRGPAARTGSTLAAHRAQMPAAGPRVAAAQPHVSSAEHMATGLIDLGGDASSEALGLAVSPVYAAKPAASVTTPDGRPTPGEPDPFADSSLAARARSLAGYGRVPERWTETVPYFVRVMLRRRILQAELSALTSQRKRFDQQAEEALCQLGESLYALQTDPRLAPLAQQLKVVNETRQKMGATQAAGQKVEEQLRAEQARLTAEIAKVEAVLAPLRQRDAELQGQADALKAQAKGKEAGVRRLDAELKALRASTDATAVDRITAVEAEREAASGEIQALNVRLLPLQEELGALRREMAKHLGVIAAHHEQQARVAQTMEREQARSRLSTGGARTAHRDALRGLAQASARAQLSALAPERAQAATDAEQRAKEQRDAEELHRAATDSYDHRKYTQGMLLLIGTTAGVFVSFAGLILF